MKILCITPLKHLEGVYDNLGKCGEIFYEPELNVDNLKSTLQKTQAEYLFTNPNKQNFILDEIVLSDTNLKVINTCSTGLNSFLHHFIQLKMGIGIMNLMLDIR